MRRRKVEEDAYENRRISFVIIITQHKIFFVKIIKVKKLTLGE